MPYHKPVVSSPCFPSEAGMKRRTNQSESTFGALCKTLAQIAESTSVPVTCVLVQDGIHTYKKTLLGNTRSPPSSSAPSSELTDLQQADGDFHLNGVPRRLREAGVGEIDQLGGDTLFMTGSLVKPVLALTCSVIIENNIIANLTWETPVIAWIKKLYGHSKFISCIEEEINPTVRDLFLNNDALPSINRFLFLADGVCQISNEDFISSLDSVFSQSKQYKASHPDEETQGGYEYTNGNAIWFAILLERAMNRSIDDIMKEYVFEPLGMSRTTLSRDQVMKMARDGSENVSLGQRLSGDLTAAWPTALEQPYRNSTVFKMSVGMWSCTNDLAKMYNAICNALDSKPGYITRAVVDDLLNASGQGGLGGSEGICVAPAGLLYHLGASDQGHESLNYTVRDKSGLGRRRQKVGETEKQGQKRGGIQKHGKKAGRTGKGSDPAGYTVVYKGGTCDGFTATTYLHLLTRKFAIVLSNTSGPVDITEPIARHLLETAVNCVPPSETQLVQNNLQAEIREQLAMALPLWQAIEAEDRDLAAWSDDTERFAGVYEHEDHQLQIDIRGGRAYFRRVRQHGPENVTVMRIGASGNRLRLFPLQQGVFIDRLTSFRDLQLVVREGGNGKRQLMANGDWDMFVKK